MHIDHVELDQAARAFVTEGEDLEAAVYYLLGRIDDLGDVFGDDDGGRTAQQGFARAREQISLYSNALCRMYGMVGVNLSLMNGNVHSANWNTMAALPAVDRASVPRFGS